MGRRPPGAQSPPDFFSPQSPACHLHDGSHHHPHHPVEKAVTFEFERDNSATAVHPDPADRANSRGNRLSPTRREGCEVMPAEKFVGRGLQLTEIKRGGDMPGAIDLKGRQHRPGRDPVAVNLSDGAEAGVEGC